MRLAIVAASSYAQNRSVAELSHVGPEVDWLCQRLTEADACFAVQFLTFAIWVPAAFVVLWPPVAEWFS